MRLKRHFSIIGHSPDVVELRYGTWNPVSFTLADESQSGHLLGIMRRLDGHASVAEIAAAEGASKAEVEALLDQLTELDLVEEHSTHVLDYYLDHIMPNLLPQGTRPEVSPASVVLFGDSLAKEQLAHILNSSNLQSHYKVTMADDSLRALLLPCGSSWLFDSVAFEEGVRPFAEWRGRFVVFATSTVNPLEMRAFNRISLHYRIPWLHAAMDGPFLLIGPTFIPFRSPCYECLETRVLMNLRESASYQNYKRALVEGRADEAAITLDAALAAMLTSLTGFEALNFLLTGASFTVGKVLSVYLPTLEFTFNEFLRLPGCPACGAAPERDDRELYFDVRTLLDNPQ